MRNGCVNDFILLVSTSALVDTFMDALRAMQRQQMQEGEIYNAPSGGLESKDSLPDPARHFQRHWISSICPAATARWGHVGMSMSTESMIGLSLICPINVMPIARRSQHLSSERRRRCLTSRRPQPSVISPKSLSQAKRNHAQEENRRTRPQHPHHRGLKPDIIPHTRRGCPATRPTRSANTKIWPFIYWRKCTQR